MAPRHKLVVVRISDNDKLRTTFWFPVALPEGDDSQPYDWAQHVKEAFHQPPLADIKNDLWTDLGTYPLDIVS